MVIESSFTFRARGKTSIVGLDVGEAERDDGLSDADRLGLVDGLVDGVLDGELEGNLVGEFDGPEEGDLEGDLEGEWLGILVGLWDGETDGAVKLLVIQSPSMQDPPSQPVPSGRNGLVQNPPSQTPTSLHSFI